MEDFDLVILVGDTCLRVQCSGVHDRWVRPAQTVRYKRGLVLQEDISLPDFIRLAGEVGFSK